MKNLFFLRRSIRQKAEQLMTHKLCKVNRRIVSISCNQASGRLATSWQNITERIIAKTNI